MFIFLAQSSAEETGKLMGGAFVWIALLAGILKCVALMRRPQTSGLAVGSLLSALILWLLLSVTGALSAKLPPAARLGMVAAMVLCLFASFTAGIAGLIVMHGRRDRYNQGRKQAVWGLILSTGVACLFIAGLVQGGLQQYEKLKAKVAKRQKFNADGPPLVFEQYNFRIPAPPAGWRKIPHEKILPGAVALFRSGAQPERYAAFLATETEIEVTADLILPSVKANLATRLRNMRIGEPEYLVINGLKFLRLPVDGSVQGSDGKELPLHYEMYAAGRGKYIWETTFWSKPGDAENLAGFAAEWMAGFTVIDPGARGPEAIPLSEAPNLAAGYSAPLGREGWIEWKDAPEEVWEYSLKARRGPANLVLSTLPLPSGTRPRPEDLHRVLFARTGLEPAELTGKPVPVKHGEYEAVERTALRRLDGEMFKFLVRTVAGPETGWLLMGWESGEVPREESPVAAAFERISLFKPENVPDPERLPEAVRRARALQINDLGIAAFRRQEYLPSVAFFKAAAAGVPEDAAVTGNLMDALENGGRPEEALAAGEAALAGPLRDTVDLKTRAARLKAETGDEEGALTLWRGLFNDGHADEDDLLTCVNLMLDLERKEEAFRLIDDFHKAHPSDQVARWRATVLQRNERYPEALAALEPLLKREPPDLEALYLKGDIELEAGSWAAAGRTADQLAAAGEDTARLHALRGWSEWNRKAWAQAKAAFEKAAERDPEDASVREGLRMAAGALGQGESEISRAVLKPVEIPAALSRAIDARPVPAAEFTAGQSAVYLRRLTGVHFAKNEPRRATHYLTIKALDAAGVEAFSTLRLNFHAPSERIHVNKLTVRDEKGKVLQEGKNDDAWTSPAEGDLATSNQTLHLPVPGLRRGGVVEAVITIQGKQPADAPEFTDLLLGAGYPSAAYGIFFTGDFTARETVATGAEKITSKDGKSQSFVIWNAPGFRREAYSPAPARWMPRVVSGPRGRDWKKEAKEYLERIEDRLKPDAEAAALAKRLTAGLSKKEDRLRAIVSHVQETLTYKGIAFGSRALVPSPVSKIMADHYGDCKDHTVLLHHLLRAAGIRSHPALIHVSNPVRHEIASLDQFNHMILHVPEFPEQPWIDATADFGDLVGEPPDNLAGEEALILDPENPRFERVPAARPGKLDARREVTVTEDFSVKFQETLTFSGSLAAWMRGWLHGATPDDQLEMLRRQLSAHGAVAPESLKIENQDDPAKPLRVVVTGQLPGAWDAASRRLRLPWQWECDYLDAAPVQNRQSPWSVYQPFSLTGHTSVKGPALAKASWLPLEFEEKGPAGESAVLRLTSSASGDSGAFTAVFEAAVPSAEGTRGTWEGFQRFRRGLCQRLLTPVLSVPE